MQYSPVPSKTINHRTASSCALPIVMSELNLGHGRQPSLLHTFPFIGPRPVGPVDPMQQNEDHRYILTYFLRLTVSL